MHRTQIYLREQQAALARLCAEQEGIAFSEFVRYGVDLAIKKTQARRRKKTKNPLAGLVGKYSLGEGIVTDVARHHNDIYDL